MLNIPFELPAVLDFVHVPDVLDTRKSRKRRGKVLVPITNPNKQGRNELCNCGSGVKVKKCKCKDKP